MLTTSKLALWVWASTQLFGPVTQDTHVLACTVQGEGVHLLGEHRDIAGLWLAHTVLNRVESPYWHTTILEVVQDGYRGFAGCAVPEQWAVDVAIKALARTEDITGGCFFVLSATDVQNLGIDAPTEKTFTHQGWALHFYKEWPG